ncbi:MAG: replication initiation protein [Defluviitaleaceae bacterium]|nr:replication initiation protein [Defluviitaleaceae bacterium]
MRQTKDEDRNKANEITKSRGYLVVKRNDFIQKSRHQLSLQEQKVVLFLISRIKPTDVDFENQEFSITEFCKICGIDYDNGKNYSNLKNTLGSLKNRWVWVEFEDGRKTTLAWINKVTINPGSGSIKLKMDNDLKPFLLEIQENFTQYELLYTLAMRSRYSVRLYELLKSYEYKCHIVADIEQLKVQLDAEKYKRNNDFKIKVLDIAMREINEFTDISVSYEFIKASRKFSKVSFTINRKPAIERFETGIKTNQLLDNE